MNISWQAIHYNGVNVVNNFFPTLKCSCRVETVHFRSSSCPHPATPQTNLVINTNLVGSTSREVSNVIDRLLHLLKWPYLLALYLALRQMGREIDRHEIVLYRWDSTLFVQSFAISANFSSISFDYESVALRLASNNNIHSYAFFLYPQNS